MFPARPCAAILHRKAALHMLDFLKRTWAEIHLDRLRRNFRVIQDSLSPGCRVMAVVKARRLRARGRRRRAGATGCGGKLVRRLQP